MCEHVYVYVCVYTSMYCVIYCWLLLSNQIFEKHKVEWVGGDNGCDNGLLGVTFNNIPQTEQQSHVIQMQACICV